MDKNKERDMEMPKVVSREARLRARKELLVKEKKWNRQRDALSAEPSGRADAHDVATGRREER